jgi:DNA-binding beta-propeller fold protein YncE
LPATLKAHLGVSAGDTFGVTGAVFDAAHALLYVIGGGYGNVHTTMLTVVDIARGEVRASAPISATASLFSPTMALSRDGARLYLVGSDTGAGLLVVGTGLSAAPLGKVLANVPDIRAMALDAATEELYVVRKDRLLRLDATTLAEEAALAIPEFASTSPALLMVLNPHAGRLHLCPLDSQAVTVYRAPDLARVAELQVDGSVYGLFSHPQIGRTYVLARHYDDQVMATTVTAIEGDKATPFTQGEMEYPIGRLAFNEDTGQVLLLEDRAGQEPLRSRVRALDAQSGKVLSTLPLSYVNLSYAQAAFTHQGQLYRLGDTLLPIALSTGAVGQPIYLWISLVSASLDEGSERLYVIDSTGTIHVLDADTLQVVDVWPHVLDPGSGVLVAGPVAWANGRLYVSDLRSSVDTTLVLDATGKRVGTIAKGGKVAWDERHNRLFVTNQGVYVVDPASFEIVRAIDDTVRKGTLGGVPGAIDARYDAEHDLLFVTMSNNSPGSGSRTWLQLYRGEGLERLQSNIKADHQFVSGLVVEPKAERIWVSSDFPGSDLAVFSPTGSELLRLRGLAGPLFLDAARHRLYVRSWSGLVTVDTATQAVIGYRPLPVFYPAVMLYDAARHRLLTSPDSTSDLLAINLDEPPTAAEGKPESLPTLGVWQLSVQEDETPLVVSSLPDYGRRGLFRGQGSRWVQLYGGLPEDSQPRIVAAPGSPGTLYAFAQDPYVAWGLFRSLDGGTTWQTAMRGLTDLNVQDLALSPDYARDHTVLVATRSGVFLTRDGGSNWRLLTPIPSTQVAIAAGAQGVLHYMALAQDPTDASHLLVYKGESDTQGMERVGMIGVPGSPYQDLALSPDFHDDRMALAGIGSEGLLLSTDGGRTWSRVWSPGEVYVTSYTILRVTPVAGAASQWYVLAAPAFYGATDQSALLHSLDGGRSWRRAVNVDRRISALALGPLNRLWVGTTAGVVDTLDPTRLMWESVALPAGQTSTPTPARPPTRVPSPTPFPAGTPPAGFYRPKGRWAELWASNAPLRQALGWATEAQPREIPLAHQLFERGAMVWREDTLRIYVLYADGSWADYADTWTAEQPESDPGIVPPQGLVQPKRGFGKVWRTEPDVRARIGWAMQEEKGLRSAVQAYEHGQLIQVEGVTYALYLTGTAKSPVRAWLSLP